MVDIETDDPFPESEFNSSISRFVNLIVRDSGSGRGSFLRRSIYFAGECARP
jgi:hypothetical protein